MIDEVPMQIIIQRVRNRMIEYWEWVSSLEDQSEYQKAVPFVSVSGEAIEQWQDWQPYESPRGHFGLPVFTEGEASMIERYHLVWNEVCNATPSSMPPLDEIRGTKPWARLKEEARIAFDLFVSRGKFDEIILLAEQPVTALPAIQS